MRILPFIYLLALIPQTVHAQSTSPIRLPIVELPKRADPPLDSPVTLPADHWYVIESDAACLLFASPGPTIRVTPETGPIRLRGRFVGSSGEIETKVVRGPFVYLVEATGRASAQPDELIIVPQGAKHEREAKRVTFLTREVKPPSPMPPVPPSPPPSPVVVPIPADGLHVMIIYEPNKTLPSAQAAIITGHATRDLLRRCCTTDARGVSAYRILPTSVEFGDELPLWKTAYARPRTTLPWVIVSNGKAGYEGPLPNTEREFADLIQRFGGTP